MPIDPVDIYRPFRRPSVLVTRQQPGVLRRKSKPCSTLPFLRAPGLRGVVRRLGAFVAGNRLFIIYTSAAVPSQCYTRGGVWYMGAVCEEMGVGVEVRVPLFAESA